MPALHLAEIGHVEFDQLGRGPFGGHVLLGPGRLFPQGDVIQVNGQAGPGQSQGDGPADPPGGAGYQSY